MKNKKLIYLLLILWSFSSYAQDCNITSKANDILPDKLCAPVSLTWEVTYRGVNDAGMLIEIQVDWDDGNPVETHTAVNTNIPLLEWQYTFSHVYPIGGDKCNYQPEATLVIDGTLCTSSIQVQNVTVWDTDDFNGGILQIDPQVFPICVGNEDGTLFNDVSIWNCTPAGGENDHINSKTRWTQWVYGTNYTINNVTVDGTVEAYPFWDGVVEATEYVDAPQPPNNVSEFCNSPITAQVGEFFEITLRNWNYCNPYDDPFVAGPPTDLVNGDYPPIETTAMILIVDTPQTSLNPAGPFCLNDPQVWLSGSPAGGVWAGPGTNSSGRFRPWVAGAGTHTITYTVTDPVYGCDGTATITIEVYAIPDPDILPGPNAEVCPGDVLFIDGNPTPGSGTIISHFWSGNTSPLNATNIQAPSFTTFAQGLYSLSYTVTDDNGCSATELIAVSVNPVSAQILPDPAHVCAGEDIVLNGNPSGGTGNYVSHIWTGDIVNLSSISTQSVTFNSNTPGDYNLTYNVTDDNGCTGNDDIIVTVFENPIANAGIDDSICGLVIQVSATPSLGSGLWAQISGPGSLSYNDATAPNAEVTADIYGLYQVAWEEIHGPSCTDRDTVEIRFTEQPIAFAGFDGGVCGFDYQLEAIPSIGVGVWSVLSGLGILTFDDANLFNTEINSDVYGIYILTWTEDNGYGCIDDDNVEVSFNLVPTPAFNPIDPDGCTPFTVDFDNQSIGGTNYFWDFGNSGISSAENPTETFYNTGNSDIIYDVTLIVNNPGCGDTIVQQVTVHPLPMANYSHNGTPQCSPLAVDFVNQSMGSVTHIWNWDDGSEIDTADVISHTFINDTVFIENYAVSMIAVSEFGCLDSTVDYITVYPNPNYEISADPDSSCHPATVQFSTSPTGQTYSWDYGNGTSEIGSHLSQSQYVNLSNENITFDIQLIVSSYFGCVDTAATQIVVHPTPNIDFNIPNSTGCAPFQTNFVNNSTGVDTYLWDFGDGTQDTSSSINLEHTFENNTNNPITYYISLTGVNAFGCEDVIEKTVLVYPEINVAFTADTVACHPFNNQMYNASTGTNSYQWNFGDGDNSTLNNPLHIFNNSSNTDDITYEIILTGQSIYGCSDNDSLTIRVLPVPLASFYPAIESGCAPFETTFINNTIGGDSFDWDFGDGTLDTISALSFPYTYQNTNANPITYNVDLEVSNSFGCQSNDTKSVLVYPEVMVAFSADTVACHPFSNQMTNLSNGADSYQWNFGDGDISTLNTPLHLFENNSHTVPIEYQIVLTGQSVYSCFGSDTLDIRVLPAPLANFVLIGESGCTPYLQSIQNTSVGADLSFWNFGDGDTLTSNETNISHEYNNNQANSNIYDLKLEVSNTFGCTDQKLANIEVYPKVTALYIADTTGCSPLPVDFINQSSGADAFFWNFGSEFSSTESNPSYTFENSSIQHDTILVQLIASSEYACTDTFSRQLIIYATPNAIFDVQPPLTTYPNTTFNLSNQTVEGSWDYQWSFGDGENTSEENPVSHTYATWGEFDIWLKVFNEFCADSTKKSVKIIAPQPTAEFDFSPKSGCTPLKVSFTNLSLNADHYLWEFGDGSSSEAFEPIHVYYDAGTYYIKLTVSSEEGTHDISLGPIQVYETPEAHLEVSPELVFIPDQPIKCFNLSMGHDSVIWLFGDGNTSREDNPIHYYKEVGLYTVTLIAMTENMCMDTAKTDQGIDARSQGKIDFPNAFKPNASGPNGGTYPTPDTDNFVFHPVFRGVVDYELNIFNRWGELIFISKDTNIGWDGYYKGELSKQDVYVWRVKGKYIDGKKFTRAGDVTLLR